MFLGMDNKKESVLFYRHGKIGSDTQKTDNE